MLVHKTHRNWVRATWPQNWNSSVAQALTLLERCNQTSSSTVARSGFTDAVMPYSTAGAAGAGMDMTGYEAIGIACMGYIP